MVEVVGYSVVSTCKYMLPLFPLLDYRTPNSSLTRVQVSAVPFHHLLGMSTTLPSRITPFSTPPQTSTTTTTTLHYHLHTFTPHTLPKPPLPTYHPTPIPIPRYCMYTVLHAPYIQPPTSLIPSLFLASAPKSTIPHHLSPSPSQTSPPPHILRLLSPSGEISSPSLPSTACATPASPYSPHDVEESPSRRPTKSRPGHWRDAEAPSSPRRCCCCRCRWTMRMATSAFRPAVGIERLPVSAAARRLSNEPRESMNCKSCRKRKVSPWLRAADDVDNDVPVSPVLIRPLDQVQQAAADL